MLGGVTVHVFFPGKKTITSNPIAELRGGGVQRDVGNFDEG